MQWKALPIGQFAEAKKHARRIGEILTDLYEHSLEGDPRAALDEAQGEWERFLAIAADGEVDPAVRSVAMMRLTQAQDLVQAFYAHQVQRPTNEAPR